MARRISAEALAQLKQHEGLRLASYLCPAGVWTIGYGHTATARPGQRIDEAEAERLLRRDLAGFEAGVSSAVRVPLTQHQVDALVSFAFNVGLGAFRASTLLRRLNGGEYDAVPDELRRWTRGGGRVLPGLVRRREDEARLWLRPPPTAPQPPPKPPPKPIPPGAPGTGTPETRPRPPSLVEALRGVFSTLFGRP